MCHCSVLPTIYIAGISSVTQLCVCECASVCVQVCVCVCRIELSLAIAICRFCAKICMQHMGTQKLQ